MKISFRKYSLLVVILLMAGFGFGQKAQAGWYVASETQITTDGSEHTVPGISGNKIVWSDSRNVGSGDDIYMYDLDTSTEIPIAIGTPDQTEPDIYGNKIVWIDRRNGSQDIYMYDLDTQIESQITPTDGSYHHDTSIFSDKIVWQDAHNGNDDIYMYDLGTAFTTQITTDSLFQHEPVVSGNKIVWSDSRNVGSGDDIYMYDLDTSTEIPIAIGTPDQTEPDIYGNKIVWMDSRNGDYDIYMYDTDTAIETQITNDALSQESPIIYGNKIVWVDNRNGNYDIYMYDLDTSIESRITDDGSNHYGPSIYDNKIAWYDDRNGNYDVYMATLSQESIVPVTTATTDPVSPNGSNGWFKGGTAPTVTLSAFEADSGVDKTYYKWDSDSYAEYTGALTTTEGEHTLYFYSTDLAGNTETEQFLDIRYDKHGYMFEGRIISDSSGQYLPAISGNKIVWQDDRGSSSDIYMYDLDTDTEQQITTDGLGHSGPDISGNRIVWSDNRSGNSDVYMYDLDTATETQITTDGSTQQNPLISGNRIVWSDWRNGGNDIYVYDLETSSETRITFDGAVQYSPAISGSKIVWYDNSSGNADIYMYDLDTVTEIQITTDGSTQRDPDISGNKIVWDDTRDNNGEIYLYDLDTMTESRVTTENMYSPAPTISGNLIVWMQGSGGNHDVYMHDLVTATKTRVTAESQERYALDISADKMVWQDYRNGNADIYMATFSGTLTSAVSPDTPNGPDGWYVGTAPTITISAYDAVSGVDRIRYRWGDTGPYSDYSDPITAPEGSNTLYYYFEDVAGNVSQEKTLEVKSDSGAPLRSDGSPSGTLSSGTTEIDISLTTDEDATCKYATASGIDYTSATDTFMTTGSDTHSTSITGLTDGQSYTYYVRCQDTLGNANADDYPISFSIGSEEPPVTTLTAPTKLKAKTQSSSEIKLEWTDNSDNEQGFKLERKQDDNWKTIETLGANTTDYTDDSLDPNTEYTYRARAYRGTEESDYSNRDSATTDDTKLKIEDIESSCNYLKITVKAGSDYRNDKVDIELELESRISGNKYQETYQDTKLDGDGRATLTYAGLKQGTEFEVRARLQDADWSPKQSDTTKTCQATAPTIPIVTAPVVTTPFTEQPKTEEPDQDNQREESKPVQSNAPKSVATEVPAPVEEPGLSTAAVAGTATAAVATIGLGLTGLFILRRKSVAGLVLESQNKTPLSQVSLEIFMPDGQSVQKLTTGSDGSFSLRLKPGPYRISVQKAGYTFPSKTVQGTDEQLGTICSGNFTVGSDGETHLMLVMDRENTTV